MEIRKDLTQVTAEISRLVSIGEEFHSFDKDWSHLKNKEDFRYITKIPHEKRGKVEALYSDGRSMAMFIAGVLCNINSDFSSYPTLTSIINVLKDSWAFGRYDPNVPDVAKAVCEECNVDLWSVNQMIALFRKQEQILAAIRVTVNMLEQSDLYKMENGIPIMKQESSINVSGISGSSININSAGATATVATNYNEPTIFADMIEAIKSNQLDKETERALIDNVQALASSHQSGGFKEAYKDFMQNVSAHITVFTPFISALTSLL
ncbi:hypothetical protein UXO68_02715 [Enterobacter mori]|uniref:hypothetical protein n=1 Tax=Enterobacter mori TaxID=539813 RepID=UPI002FD67ED5